MTGYEKIKKKIAEADSKTLIQAYKLLVQTGVESTEQILVHTALTSELEKRNLVKYNEETWKYELIA